MKERFALVRRVYPEPEGRRERAVTLGRWYRRTGRLCLLGAAVSSSIDIVNAIRGDFVSTVTPRLVLDLSPHATAMSLAPIRMAIEFAVDAPLWLLLVIAAAIPYALAAQRFIRAAAASKRARAA